jgi:hypothetical protein
MVYVLKVEELHWMTSGLADLQLQDQTSDCPDEKHPWK